MSRISDRFKQLKAENKKALIPYVVAGDPVPEFTVKVMHEMVRKGADIIELGVPFSEPEAEGAVIQVAHERALTHNVSLRDTIQMVAEFRQSDKNTPVLLMGYINPIEKMGYEEFAKLAKTAGVDASLLVNVPPEEGVELEIALHKQGLDTIYLVAPTTTDARAEYLCGKSRGFTYYVSLKGTTGASTINMGEVEARFNHLKQFTKIPMVVGFGIKDGASAARVAEFADGSVVGSAIVQIFADNKDNPNAIIESVGELVYEMRTAMDLVSVG
ncbi:MAG: tryptophan synthase subunit alpha [Pseudomonadales bacterium]|nr:tryptophan synthase subunit alpha [Pseudomonadales bacterium]MDG1443537.1 tryptophan synthase subunit alpha [Pseudomonadales bacterium]